MFLEDIVRKYCHTFLILNKTKKGLIVDTVKIKKFCS